MPTATNPTTGEKYNLNSAGQWELIPSNPNADVAPGSQNTLTPIPTWLKAGLGLAGALGGGALAGSALEGATPLLEASGRILGAGVGGGVARGAPAAVAANYLPSGAGADPLHEFLAGAAEGATTEGVPLPALHYGGSALKRVGQLASSPWLGGAAVLHGNVPGAIGAITIPPIAKGIGGALEKIPAQTTSQALEGLMRGASPVEQGVQRADAMMAEAQRRAQPAVKAAEESWIISPQEAAARANRNLAYQALKKERTPAASYQGTIYAGPEYAK